MNNYNALPILTPSIQIREDLFYYYLTKTKNDKLLSNIPVSLSTTITTITTAHDLQ